MKIRKQIKRLLFPGFNPFRLAHEIHILAKRVEADYLTMTNDASRIGDKERIEDGVGTVGVNAFLPWR